MTNINKPSEITGAIQFLATVADVRLKGPHLCALSDHIFSGAAHELAAENHLQIIVEEMADRYIVVIDGQVLGHEWHPLQAVKLAYDYVYDSASRSAMSGVWLKAGVLSVGNRRVLLTGRGFMERFWIMTALFAGDVVFEGCEYCFVGLEGIIPIAGRIPVADYDMKCIPDSRRLLSITPVAEIDRMERVYMLSPRDMGVEWRVRHSGVDAIFAVESNPGGQTRLVPTDRMAVLETMLTSCVFGHAISAEGLYSLNQVVESAKTYRLFHGDPRESAAAIRECLSVIPEAVEPSPRI